MQLREEHSAEEAGEEREEDHPDQRGRRLDEDEADRRLLIVRGNEGDQVGGDQDQQSERDPEPGLPVALELPLGVPLP